VTRPRDMAPGERVLAAVRGKVTDRLPVTTYNCHGFSWSEHASWPGYRRVLDAVARTGTAVLCKVGARRVAAGGRVEARRAADDGREVVTRTLHTPAGDLREVVVKPPDQPARRVESFVKTDADIERWLSLPVGPCGWDVGELLARCREIGDAGVAYLGYDDPLAAVVGLFAQEDLLVRIHGELERIAALVARAFERIRSELAGLLAALAAPRPRVLFYTGGPEYATPPLMPPAAFARLVTPFHRRLIGMIHDAGYPVSIHCHGRIARVLDELIACGPDVIEPVEPPPQGDIDLAGLLSAASGRVSLMGYVQDQDFHLAGPSDIRRHVAAIVATLAGRGRYVAAPTCTPFAFPPTDRYVANYVAFLEAAAELGA